MGQTALTRNQEIYGDLWRFFALFPHDGWHAWREIAPFVDGKRVLDVGPGMFPRIPIDGNYFVDLSMPALEALSQRGGRCARAAVPFPFGNASFDTVCMFEVLEHVDADGQLLDEIARILKPGGVLFASCPMNPRYWTYYDRVIGHVRRYRAADLERLLDTRGFTVERVCARHDRMAGWFGAMFGLGVRFFPRFTSRIINYYLPKVAALPFEWTDGSDTADAERRGGVTFRARRRAAAWERSPDDLEPRLEVG